LCSITFSFLVYYNPQGTKGRTAATSANAQLNQRAIGRSSLPIPVVFTIYLLFSKDIHMLEIAAATSAFPKLLLFLKT
jgi:hypothetical protein